ncbi:HNH/ENDO VII family nuclease [Gemella bergeri]
MHQLHLYNYQHLENGKPIELHHIGQKSDSPLAELSIDEHRSKENDGILHDKTKESEINRNTFNTEKINHWKERIREMEN